MKYVFVAKQEEVLKTALLIYGPRTTQMLKDVVSDIGKLKWVRQIS